MKLIRKLQEGGGMPFMVYTPNPASSQQVPPQAGQAANNEQQSMSKDIMKMVSDNGIPSDVDVFLKQITQFTLGMLDPNASIDSLLQTSEGYNMILSQLNKIKFNKDTLLKARDNLYSNGGLQEAAISANGTVIGRDVDGNIKSLSMEDYAKNRDKYNLLTNNELLQMRSYDKNGAFNTSMISILENGEGMENVKKSIQGVIDKMKVQKVKGESFADPKSLDVLKGIEGIQGIVKIGQSKESSRVYAQQALDYLYTTLPQSQRNLLRVKAVQLGMDPDKGALEIIKQNLLYGTEENSEVSYDLQKKPGSDGGSGEGAGVSEIQWLHDWVGNSFNRDGKGLQTMEINIGSNVSIFAPSQTIGSAIDAKTGKTMHRNSTIGNIIQDTFSTIGDGDSVYWGDEKITSDKLDNLVSTGKPITKSYLPIDIQHYNSTGEIKPDLEVTERLSSAEKEIKSKGAISDLEKLRIYSDHQVANYISKDGRGIDISNTQLIQPFALIQAMGQGRQVVKDINKTYLKEIDKTDDVSRILNNAKFGSGTKDDYLNNWFGTSIYEGTVFIHTIDNMSAAATAGGNLNTPKSRFNIDNVERNNMSAQRQLDYKSRNFSSNILE